MVDTWATVGSCAQIGRNVHLSGGVGIGGVLEPLQANPTIIEDNCFIGARSEVVEGVIVEENCGAGHGRVHRPEHEDLQPRDRRGHLWPRAGGIGRRRRQPARRARAVASSIAPSSSSRSTPRRARRPASTSCCARESRAMAAARERRVRTASKPAGSCRFRSSPPKTSRRCAWPAASRPSCSTFSTPHVQPGITTGELDRIAHDHQVNVQHVVPATLNYAPPGHRPYPASICTSVNHVVCHGIPGDKKLKPGDIVNIDVTVIKDGWHGDTSRMFYVGTPSIQAKRLVRGHLRGDVARHPRRQGRARGSATSATRSSSSPKATAFRSCANSAATGSAASSTRSRRSLHYGRPGTGLKLQPGMIFTIEPMINAGRAGDPRARRRLDDRHRRPLAVRAVGAHGAGDRRRLRGAHAVRRRAAAARRLTGGRSRDALAMTADAAAAPPPAGADARRAALARRSSRGPRRAARRVPRAPDTPRLLREHARLVDRVLARRLGRPRRARRAPRWSPSAATAAASSSRIPTSTS